ncbi:MAG TPA: nitroreductase family protein [Burkholderiales bacterium]|nr:nitroreductase family protein [Burkholderiales bacterium]
MSVPSAMDKPAQERIADATRCRYGEAVDVHGGLPGLDALAVMNERSVCRRYRPDPVPEDLFRLLCATALASPTKSDLQQADIVRVTVPAKRAAIHALLPSSPWIAGAPEFLVFCGDGFRLRRIFERRGVAFPNEHLDAFFNAAVDGAIVLAAFVQAAELAGLGSCPISEIRNHAATVSELLGLPDWVFPIAGLALGYPESKEPMSPRLALTATVHVDRYAGDGLERELHAYDERRVRDRPYRRQRNLERFGSAERYGWTEDKLRQYSDSQRADFGAFVRSKRYRLE